GSSPPPIIRSNLASESAVAFVVGSTAGDSATRPSGSLALAVAGGELALLAADGVASIGCTSDVVDSADDSGDGDAGAVGDGSGETGVVAAPDFFFFVAFPVVDACPGTGSRKK